MSKEKIYIMTKTELAKMAIELLKKRYPTAECSLKYNEPYQLLLATRLSAQCTDARVNIVCKKLFKKYPTMESIASADVLDIIEIVRPCGLGNTKGQDLVGICQKLILDFGGELPDTMEELLSLPGVGRKTANLILGDIFHKPAVVTDTHLIRISNRLGLVSQKNPVKIEKELKQILPPEESGDFCHRIVFFGRDVCRAKNPKCKECELADFCKYVAE